MPKTQTRKKQHRSYKAIFSTMLAFGIVGLIAAFVLSIEKIHLMENPDAQLTCSFSLILNCATVMETWQSSVFGFPNMYIGLMGFPVVITVAVMGLSGAIFSRWFTRAALVGYGLGLIFAYWLFFQSVYAIEVLCPWCLVVTVSTTLIFASLLRYSLYENTLSFASSTQARVQSWLDKDYDKLIEASWLVLMAILVILKFGDALFTLGF